MKETYENMKTILDKIKYAEHESMWRMLCKVVNTEKLLSMPMLLGQQGGNTKILASCACEIAEQSKTTG